jgi:hypothetical protein
MADILWRADLFCWEIVRVLVILIIYKHGGRR